MENFGDESNSKETNGFFPCCYNQSIPIPPYMRNIDMEKYIKFLEAHMKILDSKQLPVLKNYKPKPKKTRVTDSCFDVPIVLEDLIASGLLEGLRVQYIYEGEKKLYGTLKSNGILCSCIECNMSKVISPSQFAIHGNGSTDEKPSLHIYLESGSNLREALDAFKYSDFQVFQTTIHKSDSCSSNSQETGSDLV